MSIIAVTYVYSADTDRLDVVRPAHREFLGALHERGVVRVSGPLPATDDAPGGALIVVEADDAAAALAALDDDPFREAGLVLERSAREWVPVIGSLR